MTVSFRYSHSKPTGAPIAEVFADHAGKGIFAGFVGAVAPGAIIFSSLLLYSATRGRFNPLPFLGKPLVGKSVELFTKGSLGLSAVSAVTGGTAQYIVKINCPYNPPSQPVSNR